MARRAPSARTVAALAADALDRGGEATAPGRVLWRVAGNCQSPVERRVSPRREERLGQWVESYGTRKVYNDAGYYWVDTFRRANELHPLGEIAHEPKGVVVTVEARCRKCDCCRAQKAREWAAKARAEIETGVRTWFGTLTFRPELQTVMEYRAELRYSNQAGTPDLRAADAATQFREWNSVAGAEVTKLFKRLRKAGYEFRYLLVMEAYNRAGVVFPHYHMLLHEQSVERPIRHAVLSRAWPHGFSVWKLVSEEDSKAAWYVCKYIAKTSAARVRASEGYGGSTNEGSSEPNVKTVSTVFSCADAQKTEPDPPPF